MISYTNLYEGLKTLSPDGKPPETRMEDAGQVRDMVTKAIRYDATERDWKRSRIKGLVQGNPPYKQKDLIDAGRADECNVNWRIAKYFLGLAQGMIYDVITEAETFATVRLGTDDPQNEEWGRIVTAGFDKLQRGDASWDFTLQQSQGQMCLFGPGPMIFEDELDWRTCSLEAKMLLLPEMASSNVNRWEWASVVVEYAPDRLFSRIANPDAATKRGWRVPAVRRAIMAAHPLTKTGVMYQNWSYHQDLLKNSSFYYSDQCKAIRLAHFFFREFPRDGEDEGRITEAIIDLDGQGMGGETNGEVEYLYFGPRKHENWQRCVHPFLWQHDVNGTYHSVTGLGIEMYAALEYENRLLCRLADDAFAPKLFFKPTTAGERERMSIAHVGRYGVLPAALEMVQQHVQPFLQDGIAMSREIQQLVSSNLSQFRSNAMTKQQGNPVTARQIDYEASEQAKMGKTQLARIYEQYDWLYQEKYRRATNPSLTGGVRGGKEALEFVKYCERKGVPKEALQKVEFVGATRVVGQGSGFLRQQALEFLLGLMGTLPESGRMNLIRDVIAARAGQSHVDRYAPRSGEDPSTVAQQSDAMQQVAGMKVGVPAVLVPTQNPMIYANVFLGAAEAAVQAVQQGADPAESVGFLDLAVPAVAGHLQRIGADKSRDTKPLEQRLKQVESFNEQVKGQLQAQAEERAAQQQEMARVASGTDPETQIGLAKVQISHQVKMAKLQSDVAIKAQKEQAGMALKAGKQKVEMALKDAVTASGIRLNAKKVAADIEVAKVKAAAAAKKPAPKKAGSK
jgi:hypothetical protein